MNYEELKTKFEGLQDKEQAIQMQKYLKNQFKFYGIHSKDRKLIYRDFLTSERKNKRINWDLLKRAWQDPYRELQYFVCDYLIRMEKFLTFQDMDQIKIFIVTKPWWDTIDSLIKPIGNLGLRDAKIDTLMLKWSADNNLWLKRTAIEHQLLRKDKTNTELLDKILVNNLNSSEFFINKAIGWALRDYSKTNPIWVKNFIEQNENGLSTLSIKEGSKYL